MHNVVVHTAAVRFAPQRIIKEFCQEKRDGRLVGVVGKGNEGEGDRCVLRSLQAGLGAVVLRHIKHSQRLEQRVAHRRTA